MLLSVRVQPGASKECLTWDEARGWQVRVRAPPVDGKANERVCAFLVRDVFGEAGVKVRVRVRSGETSRAKVLELECSRRCGRHRAEAEQPIAEPAGGATR